MKLQTKDVMLQLPPLLLLSQNPPPLSSPLHHFLLLTPTPLYPLPIILPPAFLPYVPHVFMAKCLLSLISSKYTLWLLYCKFYAVSLLVLENVLIYSEFLHWQHRSTAQGSNRFLSPLFFLFSFHYRMTSVFTLLMLGLFHGMRKSLEQEVININRDCPKHHL